VRAFARLWILTAVLLNIHVLWHVTPCRLNSTRPFDGPYCFPLQSPMVVRNVWHYRANDASPHISCHTRDARPDHLLSLCPTDDSTGAVLPSHCICRHSPPPHLGPPSQLTNRSVGSHREPTALEFESRRVCRVKVSKSYFETLHQNRRTAVVVGVTGCDTWGHSGVGGRLITQATIPLKRRYIDTRPHGVTSHTKLFCLDLSCCDPTSATFGYCSFSCNRSTAGPLNLLSADKFGKIWSACGQHESRHAEGRMKEIYV
jgi:hypothetical protein